MEGLNAAFILFTVLCKVHTTTATDNSDANTTRLEELTEKYISDDHRILTNYLSLLQSVEDNELCPLGMFSPKTNVCVSCTLRCPVSMYISTPCSAEMDTQCSFCPEDTSLWDVNMGITCPMEYINYEYGYVPRSRGVQSGSLWDQTVLSLPIMFLGFVAMVGIVCLWLYANCSGYQILMFWEEIKIILSCGKKKVKKWIGYTAVDTEDHMGDDIESGNHILEDLDAKTMESFTTHVELEGQGYCKSGLNIATEHVPIEMKPLGKHTSTSEVEVHDSPMWEQPHISLERLSQVSSGYKLSESLTETDASSAPSIL